MPIRQISEQDKSLVRKNQIDSTGILRCFISGEVIKDQDEIEYDHVTAYAYDGPSDIVNVKVVLKEYNRRKRDQTLFEVRDQIALERIYERKMNNVKLQDIIEYRGIESKNYSFEMQNNSITISDTLESRTFTLLEDPILKVRYFYGRLPVKWIKNDDQEGLQPRVIDPKRLLDLSKHLKKHPQLAPAISRLVNGQIYLFDGQHKTAAQILNGLNEIDCKVFISPSDSEETKSLFDQLMITNLDAHSKLRQVPFYTSTLIERFSVIHKELWENFATIEPSSKHSESNFLQFLIKNGNFERGQANEILKSSMIDAAIDGSPIKKYIADASRDQNFPLSQEVLKKGIFPNALFLEASEAVLDSPNDYRNSEIENFRKFSEILSKRGFLQDWVPHKRGTVPTQSQLRARRIWHKGSVLTWGPMLSDIIINAFNMKTVDERKKLLYRAIANKDQLERIDTYLERLFNHTLWTDPNPDIDSLLVSARKQDALFQQHSLTMNYILTGNPA